MSTSDVLDQMRSRILAEYPFLFLRTWEERRWQKELQGLADEIERGLVVWTATTGADTAPDGDDKETRDPISFLESISRYPSQHLFLIKDFHPFLEDRQVVRLLRDMAPVLAREQKALLFLGPVDEVPLELQKDASRIELPLPGIAELRGELTAVRKRLKRETGTKLSISAQQEEHLLQAVLGLTAGEAHHALTLALSGRSEIEDEVFDQLVGEKKQMIEGSDLLEFFDLQEGVGDVGGLNGLKEWILRRSSAFTERAREQGVPMPKGVLLLGVQGCGKSLTARVTARALSFPLIRLDVTKLLDKDRGSSEKNMSDVLRLMETIAPAVLWLDEIEKAFAGADEDINRDSTMAHLMGQFLIWMGERTAPVFVVATANSIANLPPEMLRRGRFDELFFIDLPNFHERKAIFDIHLEKRGWNPENYDTEKLAAKTEEFSGAEIEQIVSAAIVDAFDEGKVVTQKDLLVSREQTVPLSTTMREEIFELREWARTRCRQATSDSRVAQMLDEEKRRGHTIAEAAGPSKEKWRELAQYGQLKGALVEFVHMRDNVTFAQLQAEFADYLETAGEQGLALKSDPNVVLWVGMSQELCELLSKLIAAKRLYLHPAEKHVRESMEPLARLTMLPELPLDPLKHPGWLPVIVRDLPPEMGSGRFARVARMMLSR